MVAFGHTAVGASVGLATYSIVGDTNPALTLLSAGAAGLISHYTADLIPHGHFFISQKNYGRNIALTIVFDFLLSVGLFLYTGYLNSGLSLKLLSILFAIGGAQFPDILDNLIRLKLLPYKGFLRMENKMHMETHWHGKNEKALLLSIFDIWQLLVILGSLWFVATF